MLVGLNGHIHYSARSSAYVTDILTFFLGLGVCFASDLVLVLFGPKSSLGNICVSSWVCVSSGSSDGTSGMWSVRVIGEFGALARILNRDV